MEIWQPISISHEVANTGWVRLRKRSIFCPRGNRTDIEQAIIEPYSKFNKLFVTLDGKRVEVGLLVAKAFLDGDSNAVEYIDGDYTNTHVDNLRWV